MDAIGDVLREYTEKEFLELERNAPKDEWKCEKCGSVETSWMVSFSWFFNEDIKYIHSECLNCENLQKEKLLSERKAKKQMYVDRLIKRSRIPKNISKAIFDMMEIRKGAEKAFTLLKKIECADRWLYIEGDNSIGKSYLIGAAINRLSQIGVPSFYLNEVQFFDRLKSTWSVGSKESEEQIMDLFKMARVIFWDEFLFNRISDEKYFWKYEKVYGVLEELSESNKIVVFATNISFENVESRAGKRIFARLKRNNIYNLVMNNDPFY